MINCLFFGIFLFFVYDVDNLRSADGLLVLGGVLAVKIRVGGWGWDSFIVNLQTSNNII